MAGRRGSASIAANPVLIGAATVLVSVIAVFLSYNANNGLPFVPTYQLQFRVPSAANLVKGNEVRVGGTRVGVVSEIIPRLDPKTGGASAVLNVKLEPRVKPLPVDSTILVRPRSALGLKFVEIEKGTSTRGYADGAVVPLTQAKPQPVEIDQVINTFDLRTRAASQQNLINFGDALAGRGGDLSRFIADAPELLRRLVPVSQNLADPKTGLARFFRALGRLASQVAPVAETQAALFRNLDTTFGALDEVKGSIQDSITTAPPFLDAGIRGFPQQRPFIRNTALLFRDLRPGIRSLAAAAPDLADAFRTGANVLPKAARFTTNQLKPTFSSVQRFSQDPNVPIAFADLIRTSQVLDPTLKSLKPTQMVCNYATLFFRNIGSLLSEGDRSGTAQRFVAVAAPQGKNNEGGPSSAPADGGGMPDVNGNDPNHLHSNPYPRTGQGDKPECESGNERFIPNRTVIGNTPGNEGAATDKTTIQDFFRP